MRKYTLLFAVLMSSLLHAQTWNDLEQNENLADIEKNPLKGFVDLFNPANNFPSSVSASLFKLDQVMIGMDNFNWDVIDNYLAQEVSNGKHSYIQVNIDPANGTSDMPEFLTNQIEWYYFEGDPANGVPADSCPNWNNQLLVDAMLNFIDALGIKYNNDDRVFMVHLGLYGMWGEWHIGSVMNEKPEYEMTEANRLALANAYKDAFPDKILLARFPEHMPDPQLFGYSDGLFFTESISDSQWDFGYFHNTLKNYNADENWRLHPIGGEIDPCIQPTLWENWPNTDDLDCNGITQDVQETFDKTHPTWLFSHYVFTELTEGTQEWDNAIRAQKLMGYTLYLDQYRLTASGGIPTVEVNIQNTGLAPMYANWDVEFGVFDSNNNFQPIGSKKWDVNLIQPDAAENYRSFISNIVLGDGTYNVVLRIVNPLEDISANAEPVRFANVTQDQDLEGWITLGEMMITNGNLGTPPVPVSSMTLTPSNLTMTVGDEFGLTSIVSPSNASNQALTWVSDHPGTASVDAEGNVFAGPSYGTVTITAYTQDGGFIGESEIIVEPAYVDISAQIEAEDYVKMAGIAVLGVSSVNSKIGFIDEGDWLEYAVSVSTPTNFVVDIYASSVGGSEVSLINEQGDILEVVPITNTNDFTVFEVNTSGVIPLTPGNYILRLLANEGNVDLDWVEFIFEGALPVELLSFTAGHAITVFPNPTTGNVMINWNNNTLNPKLHKIRLLNVLGANLTPSTINNNAINLSGLPNGMYFLELELEGDRITKRILKN